MRNAKQSIIEINRVRKRSITRHQNWNIEFVDGIATRLESREFPRRYVSQRRSLLRFRNRWIANVGLMGNGNLRSGSLMIARKSTRWGYNGVMGIVDEWKHRIRGSSIKWWKIEGGLMKLRVFDACSLRPCG